IESAEIAITATAFLSSTLLGGAGADTFNANAQLTAVYIDGGAGSSLISASAGVIGSTLLGGTSNDIGAGT
ncbi:MAG: hypothetical protein EB160_09855, partial [Nitrososphaeria archaeon]|nr:hypothetical protein [Nitrososphaeria archaeon]